MSSPGFVKQSRRRATGLPMSSRTRCNSSMMGSRRFIGDSRMAAALVGQLEPIGSDPSAAEIVNSGADPTGIEYIRSEWQRFESTS